MGDLQGLVEHIRKIKRGLKAVLVEGELLGVFSQRARGFNPRFWGDFWALIGESVRRSLCQSVAHLNKLLPTPWQDNLRLYCVRHNLLKADSQDFDACKSLSRDPPKVFCPIPRIEIGGCTRSDSLIAPAI